MLHVQILQCIWIWFWLFGLYDCVILPYLICFIRIQLVCCNIDTVTRHNVIGSSNNTDWDTQSVLDIFRNPITSFISSEGGDSCAGHCGTWTLRGVRQEIWYWASLHAAWAAMYFALGHLLGHLAQCHRNGMAQHSERSQRVQPKIYSQIAGQSWSTVQHRPEDMVLFSMGRMGSIPRNPMVYSSFPQQKLQKPLHKMAISVT